MDDLKVKKAGGTIAVFFGGCSTEYEVSLQSACSVIQNMNLDKYNLILVGIEIGRAHV